MSEPERSTLTGELVAHGIELPADQAQALQRFCQLLWDWNTKLNLTRHTDYATFVGRDLVDVLELSQHLAPGETVVDVGTGGGLPGIPLAIIRPDLELTLIDSVGKKVRAVEQMVDELQLSVTVEQDKIAHLLETSATHFHSLVARAVGRMDVVLNWLAPHWGKFDRLLLLKGPRWTEERGQARHLGLLSDKQLRRLSTYRRPGADGESVLLEIRPAGSSATDVAGS